MSFYPNETDLAKGGLVSRSTLLPKKGKKAMYLLRTTWRMVIMPAER